MAGLSPNDGGTSGALFHPRAEPGHYQISRRVLVLISEEYTERCGGFTLLITLNLTFKWQRSGLKWRVLARRAKKHKHV